MKTTKLIKNQKKSKIKYYQVLMQLATFKVLCLLQIFKINRGDIFEYKNLEIKETKSGLIIKNLCSISKIKCVSLCHLNAACEFVFFNGSNCILYSFYSRFYIQQSSSQFLIEKSFRRDTKIINYWPIENGNTNDLIDSKNMHSPSNAEFAEDRFGNPNSAINLSSGFMVIPSGDYFGNAFTILGWVKIKSYEQSQRFLEFGSGTMTDNIIIELSNSNRKLEFQMTNRLINAQRTIMSNMVVQLNRWYHLTFIQINGKMSIHVDGNREAYWDSGIRNLYRQIVRTQCYFGKSNSFFDPKGNFVYDEIKFFGKELTHEEIKSEFNFGYH